MSALDKYMLYKNPFKQNLHHHTVPHGEPPSKYISGFASDVGFVGRDVHN